MKIIFPLSFKSLLFGCNKSFLYCSISFSVTIGIANQLGNTTHPWYPGYKASHFMTVFSKKSVPTCFNCKPGDNLSSHSHQLFWIHGAKFSKASIVNLPYSNKCFYAMNKNEAWDVHLRELGGGKLRGQLRHSSAYRCLFQVKWALLYSFRGIPCARQAFLDTFCACQVFRSIFSAT